MKTILILASNPRGDLRIDREIRDLESAIERSKNSELFEIKIKLAVTVENLDELLYDNQPYIVHFCGHGAGKQGLVFENQEGVEQFLSNEALSNLFRNCGREIECVLLNACHTEVQADLIVEHIPYVIGTSREILDKAAYYFSVGFYKGLVREQSIEVSYKWGYNSIQRNMPNVEIKFHSTEKFRKMEVLEDDDLKIASEPLKIILKRKTVQENKSQATKLSVNIPPEVDKEIIEEGNRKRYYDKLRDVLDRFGQTTIEREEPISEFEYRQRQTFLKKVKEFWIEGFLKPSLCFNIAIDRNVPINPSGQILRPLDNLEVIPIDIDESYDELQQTDIMGQIGGGKTLLILGEPGSGKTIALLQLAKRLIELTKLDMTKPIPVVLNLSSWGQNWGQKQQVSLKKWLIKELQEKYQVPKSLSKAGIKQEQLILLLDGLDEVGASLDEKNEEKAKQQRNACVRAINKFIAKHLQTEIVVCSRVKDYGALTEKLLLSSVICIQPLSKQQLLEFLKNADDSLSGLKTVIERDREIAEFAQTPLILNMMTWTYQNCSAEECYKQFRISQDRLDNLFESYIEKNLERENEVKKSEHPIFVNLLSKLTRRLGFQGIIESFMCQIGMLPKKYTKEKILFWLSWLAKRMMNESQTVFLIEKIQPTWLESRSEIREYQIRNFLIGGLIGWLIGGLFMLSNEITLFEQMSWSWQKAKSRLIRQLGLGLILGLIIGLLQVNPIGGLIMGLIGGLIFGLYSGLGSTEVEQRTFPNQGIWSSAKNFALVVLIVGLIIGLIMGLVGLIAGIFGMVITGMLGLIGGLVGGLILFGQWFFLGGLLFGPLVGLQYGGATCIKHFNLRWMLYQKGLIPCDYARFLGYASERLLMKKVGGGYVFYHRMLMEHFAQREID
ncbi:MAG: NACHT domain-containing protein [Xenococcus sp. MO_188.B8]|nr:NACHT domain-containing protein [Xenococcus sp. MO_188.B8]